MKGSHIMSETLFESDTMYDDYVADERDHISGDAAPADGTTFTREDGSQGVWINGLPRTVDAREHDAFCECEGCDAKRDAEPSEYDGPTVDFSDIPIMHVDPDEAPDAHYHVVSGMAGGYTPNSNYYAPTIADAHEMLRDAKDQFLADLDDAHSTRRVYGTLKHGFISYVDTSDPHDLGEYAEIVACSKDCSPDDEY